MKLKVNGEDREVAAATVLGLLEELKVDPVRVAVEVNLSIVRRTEFGSSALHEGDAVEIVNFVGGGER